jgi:hypothetical protein
MVPIHVSSLPRNLLFAGHDGAQTRSRTSVSLTVLDGLYGEFGLHTAARAPKAVARPCRAEDTKSDAEDPYISLSYLAGEGLIIAPHCGRGRLFLGRCASNTIHPNNVFNLPPASNAVLWRRYSPSVDCSDAILCSRSTMPAASNPHAEWLTPRSISLLDLEVGQAPLRLVRYPPTQLPPDAVN